VITPLLISISWPALHARFGTGFKAIRQFKPHFTEAIEGRPPEAIMLHPAGPPIARIAWTKGSLNPQQRAAGLPDQNATSSNGGNSKIL
jgi:hypothetical protein